jgi:two-component system sensor histidine kinase RpfC
VVALATAGDPRPVLDRRKLEGLAVLDQGDGFIDELVDTFVSEAAELVDGIEQAVAQEDVAAMRDHAHALRSSAAHVGATALFDVLLGWRGLDDAALLARGPAEVQRLRLELERATTGLMAWHAEQALDRRSTQH